MIVTISDKGKSVIEKAVQAHAVESAEILGGVNKKEQTVLQQIVRKLIAQLQ